MSIHELVSYPTPFDREVGIYYELAARASGVEVSVYSIAGRKVWEETAAPGEPNVNRLWWDGRDAEGQPVANGTYLVHVRATGPKGTAQETTTAVKIR
jgi:flagellar hook assembly protein FlgD